MITLIHTVRRLSGGILRAFRDPEFKGLFLFAVLILAIGTIFYQHFEGWTWLDSLYFSVTTLTTIGFGDLAPTTPISKIFTIGYCFVGIGIFLAFIDSVGHHARDEARMETFISIDDSKPRQSQKS